MTPLNLDNVESFLHRAQWDYEGRMDIVHILLARYIDFEWFLQWQPSDGWTIVAGEKGVKVAPLSKCIEIIKDKGVLSFEDYLKFTI